MSQPDGNERGEHRLQREGHCRCRARPQGVTLTVLAALSKHQDATKVKRGVHGRLGPGNWAMRGEAAGGGTMTLCHRLKATGVFDGGSLPRTDQTCRPRLGACEGRGFARGKKRDLVSRGNFAIVRITNAPPCSRQSVIVLGRLNSRSPRGVGGSFGPGGNGAA